MHIDNRSYLIEFSQITLKYDFLLSFVTPHSVVCCGKGVQRQDLGQADERDLWSSSLCRIWWVYTEKKINFIRFPHLFQFDVTKEGLWQYHTAWIRLGFLGKLSDKFCFHNCKKCSLTQGQDKDEITLRKMH